MTSKFRSFEQARKFARSLNIRGSTQWKEYCKSGKRPNDIPVHPEKVYKDKWISWSDWTGNKSKQGTNKIYLPFEEARDFVHSLKLKNNREWRKYAKSGKRPEHIPFDPKWVYPKQWNGYEDWLGYVAKRSRYKNFIPFEEAKKIIKRYGLTSLQQWVIFTKDKQFPKNIPKNPHDAYNEEWKGYTDFLGVSIENSKYGRFRKFSEAREFVRSLKLYGNPGWNEYKKSGKKPKDIPSHPEKVYKDEWKGWVDWTGIDARLVKFRKLRPFSEAREFVRSLGLKNEKEWKEYKKSGKKPKDIPSTPIMVYKTEYKGLGDWLGTGNVSFQKRVLRPFSEAREFVRSLGLKNGNEWTEYCQSGKKPKDIPSRPENGYKDEWKGLGDWLGTGTVAPSKRVFKSFSEARKFIRSLNLKNINEWEDWSKSKRPSDIPGSPHNVYKDEWKGMKDWLGTLDESWSVNRIKEVLKGLIDSGIIYEWNEAVLYSLLLRKGLLNLGPGNRHDRFFKNMLAALRTPAGRDAVKDYVDSNYEEPPDFEHILQANDITIDPEKEIPTASQEELVELTSDIEPLDYQKTPPVEHILRHTENLESINVDEEAIKFYLNYSINQLWKNAFSNEQETVEKIRNKGKNGNKYHDEVIEKFLSDYDDIQQLEIPVEYSFPKPPVLMQKYVAYKILNNPFFGNFSGTGAGKTLSAILSSRIIDSKLTLIVCPNDVVEHWNDQILEIFPNSKITTGKDAFFVKYDDDTYHYAILNYDKFNQAESANLILELGKTSIDFVVLDEIHFSKIRDKNISQRRQNLDGLMTMIRKTNPEMKVLGVSATPVVNNLTEGRSLLELITGKVYDDVATRPTIPNAVTLYEKISNISVREMPDYPIQLDTRIVDVEAEMPNSVTIQQLKSNPLSIEQILTDSRIPEMIRLIDGQTIIYTEYVEQIVEKIAIAVREAGYSFAFFTGADHSGLKQFLKRKVQVLIASRPISTGIDGLQQICNRLIINTLPWTNAQYQQLLGRLVRRGQIQDVVHVHILKASIGGYPYDQLKLDRIKFKKTLADCAVDGTLPEKNLVTPSQAMSEAVKWLERLEKGEISTVTRRDLNVKLNPVDIEQRIKKYGDFERFNRRINTEKSETTHLRLNENPEEWLEYHRQYREARESWTVIPFNHWISRLKQLSPRLEIGDFGCGEAKIQAEFGDRVHSFDHVSINEGVTSCDISSVPLDDGSLDVVVFSLSLMGKNWSDYLKEAYRCLATNGFVFISETSNAINGRLVSLKGILKECGFEIYDDFENGNFTFIEARKL